MSLVSKHSIANAQGRQSYPNASFWTSQKTQEKFGFSTIDGHVVNHLEVSQAISSGEGIFIGDYFVGSSNDNNPISNLPFVRY
jgi:hypothetical protein